MSKVIIIPLDFYLEVDYIKSDIPFYYELKHKLEDTILNCLKIWIGEENTLSDYLQEDLSEVELLSINVYDH